MSEADNPVQADVATVLQTLIQQQTAIFQQQAALLQFHGESVRMQRLLIEQLVGSNV